MARSIKISDNEVEIIQQEALLANRSIAGQAEHWLRIGRAIEQSTDFNYQHIRDALSGITSPDELNAEEQEVFFEEFSDSMWEVTPEQEQFFSARAQSGKGVGLDNEDNLIYESPNN